MNEIIRSIEAKQIRSDLPQFNVGDTVRVWVKVVEGNRERLQAFEGTVIAKRNGGIRWLWPEGFLPFFFYSYFGMTKPLSPFENRGFVDSLTAAPGSSLFYVFRKKRQRKHILNR